MAYLGLFERFNLIFEQRVIFLKLFCMKKFEIFSKINIIYQKNTKGIPLEYLL